MLLRSGLWLACEEEAEVLRVARLHLKMTWGWGVAPWWSTCLARATPVPGALHSHPALPRERKGNVWILGSSSSHGS